ncbi:MAG: S8 family serine peptidase [Phycisphaeraceae bacterium]|nr:S8 family serine peptidase [Phycisphaeraceae bacterium]
MKMLSIACAGLFLASGAAATPADLESEIVRAGQPDLPYVAGELIVGFQLAPTPEQQAAVQAALSGQMLSWREIAHAPHPKNDANGVHPLAKVRVLTLAPGSDVLQAMNAVSALMGVRYAHPNYITETCETPNDPLFNQQYGPQIVNAPDAWDIEPGSPDVVLAIADTGLNFAHEEFQGGRIWENPGEIPGNGIDDDANGYIDDINGRDCINDDNTMTDTQNGHGTHVAGISAAGTDNGVGIAGMARGVKLMILKVFQSNGGGTWEAITEAIYYATDNGANVLNYSGGGGGGDGALSDACTYAFNNGMPVVAAAGNNGSGSNFYPAAYSGVIAVAATDSNDDRAGFSNFGNWVDVAAPGVDVLASYVPSSNSYDSLSGTSMSSPHVAGLVALILSINPDLTPQEVTDLLHDNAVDLGSPGFDQQYGYGRIDALATLEAVPGGCPADIDGDGDTDGDDFFGYLDLFSSGDDAADLDGDGDRDADDFFMYLDLFSLGC